MSVSHTAVDLLGLTLANPVMVAAGCGGTGQELAAYGALTDLGAFVTRSISLAPRSGGRLPRVVETPSGLVHAVNLQNPGLASFLEQELPWLARQGMPVVVSVVAASPDEYQELAHRIAVAPGVAAIEVNLSAPDAVGSGIMDVREPFQAAHAITAIRRELPRGFPVLAKLRSDPFRLVETARAVVDAGADVVVVGNALPAVMPDGRPAGLSGPAIRPVALRCVRELHEAAPEIRIVGGGGIATIEDMRAFLDAGAVAVQIGAALLHDPTLASRLAAHTGGLR